MALFQKELLLIPCCARKQPKGHVPAATPEPLSNLVSHSVYSDILEARRDVLSYISRCEKYLSGKYIKNRGVRPGPDFGGRYTSGRYLSAIERYKGTLYQSVPATLVGEGNPSQNQCNRHVLILSALYGPLHPGSDIQDYNLKMSDLPAYKIWKAAFPTFLRNYVTSNEIQSIYLFLGTTTHYLKIARLAVKPLLDDHLITEALQYHVIDGNSNKTPKLHGKIFARHLKYGRIKQLPEDIKECRL